MASIMGRLWQQNSRPSRPGKPITEFFDRSAPSPCETALEHFQEKWNPVFRPKMRQCKNAGAVSVSSLCETALAARERLADRIEAMDGANWYRGSIVVIRGRLARLPRPGHAAGLIVENCLPALAAVRIPGDLGGAQFGVGYCG